MIKFFVMGERKPFVFERVSNFSPGFQEVVVQDAFEACMSSHKSSTRGFPLPLQDKEPLKRNNATIDEIQSGFVAAIIGDL